MREIEGGGAMEARKMGSFAAMAVHLDICTTFFSLPSSLPLKLSFFSFFFFSIFLYNFSFFIFSDNKNHILHFFFFRKLEIHFFLKKKNESFILTVEIKDEIYCEKRKSEGRDKVIIIILSLQIGWIERFKPSTKVLRSQFY